MGAACVLTGALALALPHKDGGAGAKAAAGGSGVTVAARADADDCNDRSPRPSGKDGPAIDAIKNREVKKLVVGVDQNSYRWGYRDPNKKGGASRASTSTWRARSPRRSSATATPWCSAPSRPISASRPSRAGRSTWWCAP